MYWSSIDVLTRLIQQEKGFLVWHVLLREQNFCKPWCNSSPSPWQCRIFIFQGHRAIGRSHNRVTEVAEVTAFRLASKIPKGSQGHALSRHSSQPHGVRPTCSNVFNILFDIEFNAIELIESVRCQTETIQYVGSWNVLHTSRSSQAFRIIHLVIAENYAGLLKITACAQAWRLFGLWPR